MQRKPAPDHEAIYRHRAAEYDQLVSREDYQGHLLPALQRIRSLEGLAVVEFGAGTGRLTALLTPHVRRIQAFDASPPMLDVARARLEAAGPRNWRLAVGDHRAVSAEDGIADLAISGWSICYVVQERPDSWREELERALAEMRRVLRPDGHVVLIETLGTGREQPLAPDRLAAYYDYLRLAGFDHAWIRTDYRFRDRAEAERLTRFFFGESMVGKIQTGDQGIILPECTGLWWRHRGNR